jgi:hypothetical protein
MRTHDELKIEELYESVILRPRSNFFLVEDIYNKMQILLKQNPNLTEEDIISIIEYDPTGNKGLYVPWILKLVSRGILKFPEDGEKVKETLTQFHTLKNAPQFTGNKDINSYKTYGDLAEAVNQNKEVKTKGQLNRTAIEQGMQVIYEDPVYTIIKITTPQAAAKLCRDTKWCVKDPKFSKDYLSQGPLFMLERNDQPYVLFHFETKSIKDIYDRSITKDIADEIRFLLVKFTQFKTAIQLNPPSQQDVELLTDYLDPEVLMEFITDSGLDFFLGTELKDSKETVYDKLKALCRDMLDSAVEQYAFYDGEGRGEDTTLTGDWNSDFLVFTSHGNILDNTRNSVIDQAIKNLYAFKDQ